MGYGNAAGKGIFLLLRPFDGPSRDGFLHGRMATGHKKRREKALPPTQRNRWSDACLPGILEPMIFVAVCQFR